MISLKYEVADTNGQAIDAGILQCDVSSIDDSYHPSNALQLLQPLFIPGKADGTSWTINNDTFKTKVIVGTQSSNPQGGTDLLGFIKSVALQQGIADLQTFLDNANAATSIVATDAKAVITFTRNTAHDGLQDRPLDYFSMVSGFLPNRVSDLELQGYRVATAADDAVTFKIGCYIPINLPDSDVSYIHVQ